LDLVEVIVPRLNVVVEVTVSPTSVTVEAAVAVMKKVAVSVTVCATALKQRRRSKLRRIMKRRKPSRDYIYRGSGSPPRAISLFADFLFSFPPTLSAEAPHSTLPLKRSCDRYVGLQ